MLVFPTKFNQNIMVEIYLSIGPVSETSKRVHYWVVFVPIPEQRLSRSLDYVPLSLVYYFLPSNDGSGPPPPSPPSKIHSGSLPSAIFLYPLYFPLLPPLRRSTTVRSEERRVVDHMGVDHPCSDQLP